ncbi:MAG: rhodanese-like domain-containing protein [Candidatus Heimdallarchaeota archaeon]
MKRRLLTRFSSIYLVDTFMKIMVNRVRIGAWPVPEITPDELYEKINSNQSPLLIYVLRIVGEDGLIKNIKRIHTRKLISYVERLESYKEKEVVTVCGGGGMSLVAAEIMIEAGFKNVKSLNGGMQLWNKKGYPIDSYEVLMNR